MEMMQQTFPAKRLLLLVILVAMSLGVQSQTLFNVTQHDVDSIFTALHNAIKNKKEYSDARYERIREKEKLLATAGTVQRITILKELISEHMNFRSAEVLKWIDMLKAMPEYNNDHELSFWTKCHEAQCYAAMGLTHKAHSILHSLDENSVSTELRVMHNEILLQAYNWEMSTFNFAFPLSDEEEQKRLALQDAILESTVDEKENVFTQANVLMEKGKIQDAISVLKSVYDDLEGQEMTYLYATMADIYMHANDTLSAVYALAATSIRDLESANADYMCLPVLVQYLSKMGDIENAYHFLLCCIDDARLYPAYFISGESSNIFPVINNEYLLLKQHKEQNEAMIRWLVITLVFMTICFVFAVVYLRNKNKMTKQLEQKNIELTKANNVKSQFIRNMTHEMHTPLNSISGFAQVLASSDDSLDSKSQKEMASYIYEGSVELTKQLDNMISLSNVDSLEASKIMKKEVRVADVLQAVKDKVVLPDSKPLTFDVQSAVNDEECILTDKHLLVDAILQLIDNSIKFSSEGSIILLVEKENEKMRFVVTDEGKGIPSGLEETVFERFYKIDTFVPGAGIGLSLCRTIVTLLGGNVSADTTHTGKGTSMVIELG